MFIQNGEWVIIFKHKTLKKVFKSITFWLFLSFLLVGMLPLWIYQGTLVQEFSSSQIQNRVNEIQKQGRITANQLISRGYLENQNNDVVNSALSTITNIYDARVVVVDKNFKIIKDTYALEEGKISISESVLASFQGNTNDRYRINEGYITVTFPLVLSKTNEGDAVIGVMNITAATTRIEESMANIFDKTRLLETVAFMLLLVVSFGLAKVLSLPFQVLIAKLNHVADDHLDEEISVTTYTETQAISESITQTMEKLRILDESRQEFVSNVSHELKTPITSIRVLADSLMSQEEVPLELYKEFMKDISDEIDRESKIIDDLLALVKMDKATMELIVAPVDIYELLKLIFKRLRPIANRKNIELVLERLRPVTAEVDEVKITLAFTNLIENAIKYNIADGWVRVTLDADHKFCYVKVSDSGIGIPEDAQSRIYERFYRVDKARSREKGGTGLGLSITKSVILLHNGAIKVNSVENEGTTFVVRIPLTYTA